ncbi:hypothetical protein EJ04DRAFT_508462 [Polyplosphaeria fusca]|uniref:Uncharacterized protein n=1 Tax=Polyplosphaeria fusca TaxID=682080 RepID=A0A9P4R6Z7_9PLEO|nr:hypothetical protein EJ04DRAFT_508462 [Polyplosphaeria fusca]
MSPCPEKCHLLALPRELRDRIYENVLTDDDGLICVATVAGANTGKEPSTQFQFLSHTDDESKQGSNQLRYVCRQLHQETCGLALGYNNLIFTSTTQFSTFLATCSPYHQSQMRTVTIQEHIIPLYGKCFPLGWTTHLVATSLCSLCRAQPNLTMYIILDYFNADTDFGDWMVFGGALQYAVRGSFPAALEESGRIRTALVAYANHCVKGLGGETVPWNLRLVPKGMGEEGFGGSTRYGLVLEGEKREKWVGQVRKWCEEGF